MDDVKKLVEERAKTHGEFRNTAEVAQVLKTAMRETVGSEWERANLVMCEALDNIAQKIARVLTGNPYHPDAWRDIQGYCQLVLDRLPATSEELEWVVMYDEDGNILHRTNNWFVAERIAKSMSFVKATRIQWLEHGSIQIRRYYQGGQTNEPV